MESLCGRENLTSLAVVLQKNTLEGNAGVGIEMGAEHFKNVFSAKVSKDFIRKLVLYRKFIVESSSEHYIKVFFQIWRLNSTLDSVTEKYKIMISNE